MRRWQWLVQLGLAALLVWFVGRAVAGQWEALRSAEWQVRVEGGWLALAVAAALVTFPLQIGAWRTVLAGWGESLPRWAAARIWFLANLGRYVPGKVWSIAGLVVLASRQGVATWAATAGAVVMQAIGFGTALGLVAALVPGSAPALRLGLGGVLVVATLVAVTWGPAVGLLRRLHPKLAEVRPLSLGAVAGATVLSGLAWTTYGAAFWAMSRGLGQAAVLTLGEATGIFALGYIVGLLAVFAPGGAVVREAVFLALLAPRLGAGPALTLAVASRLVLTLVELMAALPFLLTQPRSATGVTGA